MTSPFVMKIERKTFDLRWQRTYERNLVFLWERGKKRVVRGLFSSEYILWLAGLLRSANDGIAEGPLGSAVVDGGRWRDSPGTVLVSVRWNLNGAYPGVERSPIARGRKAFFCIPAGSYGGGWKALAGEMESFINLRNRVVPPMVVEREGGSGEPSRSFAEIVRWVEVGAKPAGMVVLVSLQFVADERGWKVVGENLELARK